MKKELTLAVPAGIGDVSWILSKLYPVRENYTFTIEVADGWPYRTVPFLEMFPWIKHSKYGEFSYNDIVAGEAMQKFRTWKEIDECGYGRIFLSANLHLERGKRLELWLPDLQTDFHYEVPVFPGSVEKADRLLRRVKGDLYGISAASYRGSEAWKTWDSVAWCKFLKLWVKHNPNVKFVLLGGFWDDLTHTIAERFGDRCVDLVGKTDFSDALEVHKRLAGYVGFSSGLGVMRTVLGLKTFMLWPDFQEPLSTSWAPPEMLEDGSYTAVLWRQPEEVFKRLKLWLKQGGEDAAV